MVCPTGYTWVQHTMREQGALFGGAQSSHINFADRWFGFDDGLYGAARLLCLSAQVDEWLSELPSYPSTPELRLHVEEEVKWQIVPALRKKIEGMELSEVDGLRMSTADAWALVRPSNTEACLIIRVEGRDQQSFEDLVAKLSGWLADISGMPVNEEGKIPGLG